MIPGALARRYARAIFGLAVDQKLEDKVQAELQQFAEALGESNDLDRALASNHIPLEARKKLVVQVARRMALSELTVKCLVFVLDKGRIEGVADIARSMKRMVDDRLNRVDAEVVTATALGVAEGGRLKHELERITGKSIVLDQKVDPSIIGGAVTRVGHLVFDGSVRNYLEEARKSLAGGSNK